ncbi:P-loop containing nucleoside triphosphate hydrolase protein [Schizopora paradoxa]|uniref:p-loop containing nucleoside triphosphate hydrolase protein n=1 Tax=Schizopora paradoxa TaxID=27342 RepID=A0A0H2S4K7_9AGAM|nr:P-loop containing nucleoside triphosphate hydrolase protein [Schizopora paradoxa]
MEDGHLSYPRVDDKWETESNGMELEFCNVGFKYPDTDRWVLKDVSFKIKLGQMVALVGVNGSGKSTAINLFNQIYDTTEGEILIDGLPIKSYRAKDVRSAMAILRQKHYSYPLSLGVNIALGCPDQHDTVTDEEIHEALEEGGADAFIKKLPEGVNTVLSPVRLSCFKDNGEENEELNEMVREKMKHTDVSGGESQRLAASRTFMRLKKGDIRFIAADEPTSALDAEGEMAFFERLKAQHGKKTVVFITHRFGHLTKYADLILVLKDGCLVESGSHDELVSNHGEYNKLYQAQAQAFLSSDEANANSDKE